MLPTRTGLLLFVLLTPLLAACRSGSSGIRINGKPVDTTDGAEAARRYYAPQMQSLKARATPVPLELVFAEPNAQFAAANWVKGGARLSATQHAFFRDFSRTSWLVMAQALEQGRVFRRLRVVPTSSGTSDLSEQAKVAAGTLVISFNTKNRVVVYPHPDRARGVTIHEKLTPGHELEMMTNLIVAAVKRLAPKARAEAKTAAAPAAAARAAIVAVFDVEASRLKLGAELRRSLADSAATQLAASTHYRVVPRSQIKARLKRSKHASYRACFDAACQVEIGRELAAQKSLAITIAKLGSSCSVRVVLYDLKQATSEKAALAAGRCNEDGYVLALKKAIGELMQK